MVHRVRVGRSPCAADRRHLHHLLLDSGLSHGQVVALMLGLAFGLGGLGVLADVLEIPSPVRFYVFCGLSYLYLSVTADMAKRHCSELTAAPAERAFVRPVITPPEEA
jgi:UDP-GlcNAc:undecaprenyl-phosphate GlcNAc-1-phosphate transferase